MPILPPSLDDRRFDDLVDELLARIPAHTPDVRVEIIYRLARTGAPAQLGLTVQLES